MVSLFSYGKQRSYIDPGTVEKMDENIFTEDVTSSFHHSFRPSCSRPRIVGNNFLLNGDLLVGQTEPTVILYN